MMHNKNHGYLKLILSLLLPFLCIGIGGQAEKSLYPIRNLQASLTASEGYGTVTALRTSYEDKNCVLIVSYSPSELNCNLTRYFWDTHSDVMEVDPDESQGDVSKKKVGGGFMTPIAFRGAVNSPSTVQKGKRKESKSIHILEERVGICLAMTGFASDVKHLVRYIASVISDYEFLYGGEVPSIHSIVRDSFASYMRDSAARGGRPFGAQGLIVGNENNNLPRNEGVKIFTLDPSGNFRHCVSGVAVIGRNSQSIEDSIFKAYIGNENGQRSDVESSLDVALKAILENIYEDNHFPDDPQIPSKFEAVVILARGNSKGQSYNCAILEEDFVRKSYKRSIESLTSKHKLKD